MEVFFSNREKTYIKNKKDNAEDQVEKLDRKQTPIVCPEGAYCYGGDTDKQICKKGWYCMKGAGKWCDSLEAEESLEDSKKLLPDDNNADASQHLVGLSQMIRYALENVQKDFGAKKEPKVLKTMYIKQNLTKKLTHFFQKTAMIMRYVTVLFLIQ